MLVSHLQPLPQVFGVHGGAGFPLPAQLVERRERVGVRQVLQVGKQRGPVVGPDVLVRQVVGEEVHAVRDIGRSGEEVGRQHAGRQRAIAPHDLVEQLVDPLHGREQGPPLSRASR